MDKKKVAKIALTVVLVIIPFGLVTIGGYYGYKKYREQKEKKDILNKQ